MAEVKVKEKEKTQPELIEGEILPEKTSKPMVLLEYEEEKKRLSRTPEEQYEYMRNYYIENTDVEAFLENGTVSDVVKANTFIRVGKYGKPRGVRKFLTSAELQGAVDAYFFLMHRNAELGGEAIPDVEQLALFLGVGRRTLMTWKSDANFDPILDDALNRIATIKKQLAMKNKIPSLVYLSDIQNNHGYVDRKNVEVNVSQRQVADREALIESAKMLP